MSLFRSVASSWITRHRKRFKFKYLSTKKLHLAIKISRSERSSNFSYSIITFIHYAHDLPQLYNTRVEMCMQRDVPSLFSRKEDIILGRANKTCTYSWQCLAMCVRFLRSRKKTIRFCLRYYIACLYTDEIAFEKKMKKRYGLLLFCPLFLHLMSPSPIPGNF